MLSEDYVQHTQNWLIRFVIKDNICPFAKGVFVKNQIRYKVSFAKNTKQLLKDFIKELDLLNKTDAKICDTTLLIHPFVLQKFQPYNKFLGRAEFMIEQLGFEGIFQLASFHPNYQFADAGINAVENYTNRSPYPMLHILREDSLSKVLLHYPDPNSIPDRNIAFLKSVGKEKMIALFNSLKS